MYHLPKIRKQINELRTLRSAAVAAVAKERDELKAAEVRLSNTQQAVQIAQEVAQKLQQHAHEQISHVVTLCLQTIFGEGYGFRIDFRQKRGKTEAHLILLRDGDEIEDPTNEDSGGVLDVAAFALRVSALLLHKPPLRRILFMDEPFKSLSPEYRDAVRMLLDQWSRKFNTQLVMATHMDELKSGKIVEFPRK